MPHQCVRCSTFYEDGATEIIKGCKCGGKLFFYIKKEKLEQAQKAAEQINLTPKEKEQIEQDVFEMVGSEIDRDEPVVLDLEAIRILKPGKYELDLVHLFKKEPLIFKLEDGKYMVDIVESFNSLGNKRKGKKPKKFK
ncbi:MAG: Zn-ribbon domain-containing protein [Nanoarchaeota archaeon]|nr:Zn-ribbon domain-containing protein [Nanoarchaeota archaeon]MBU1004620.1 Zn-ribbon domain-containing protein [Nanoarchaeota archaeon]MBU1945516.1 Zn-ribbon domain-containing protein [Nanoarchaeota archaeon]